MVVFISIKEFYLKIKFQVDVLSLHNNIELWDPQPVNEFHADRYLTKRHPLAYMSFGAGLALCKFILNLSFSFLV
jgi:hypothetical protein